MTVSQAASALGVSTETIRKWLKNGLLTGELATTGGRWRVDTASVHERIANFGQKSSRADDIAALSAKIEQIARDVDRLAADPSGDLETVTKERDKYRAEASTMRETALRLNAAAREVNGAVRQTLDVLEFQSEALSELLGPGSPQDILG